MSAREERINELLKDRAKVLAEAGVTNAGPEFVKAFEGENYEHGVISSAAILRVHHAAQDLQDKIQAQARIIKDAQQVVEYFYYYDHVKNLPVNIITELKRVLGMGS